MQKTGWRFAAFGFGAGRGAYVLEMARVLDKVPDGPMPSAPAPGSR